MKNKVNLLTVGQKAELISQNSNTCKTSVAEISAKGNVVVSLSAPDIDQLQISKGDKMELEFYRSDGRYTMEVKVVKIDSELRAILKPLGEPVHDQRRKHFRLPVELNVTVYDYIEGYESILGHDLTPTDMTVVEIVKSKDISIRGVAIASTRMYAQGEKYMLSVVFEINDRQHTYVVCAEVMRVVDVGGSFTIGLQFFGQSEKMEEDLTQLIMQEQQYLLQKRAFA